MKKWRGALGATTVLIAALVLAGSASALVAGWYNAGTGSFSAPGCGDTSQVILAVPAKAFGVSVVRPRLGTKLTDAATGQTDATVTSIHRTRTRVTFTATGSDDVCANPDRYADNGWETKSVSFRVNYKTRVHVLYPSACDNPTYRPHRVVIACGDGTFYVDHIRWSAWTDHRATGVGTGHANDCRPSCAAGHFHAYRNVIVRLAFPRFCRAHTDYEFTGLQYQFAGARPAGFARSGLGPRGCARPRSTVRAGDARAGGGGGRGGGGRAPVVVARQRLR